MYQRRLNYLNLVCKGDLKVEEEVLQWLITQKTEDRIELITRVMLETSVEETQYLAVYFCESQYSYTINFEIGKKINKIIMSYCR